MYFCGKLTFYNIYCLTLFNLFTMEKLTLPNVYKVSAAFFIIACIIIVFFLASDIFAPIIMSFLFAILLRPAVKFMNERLKFPLVLSVTVAVLIGLLAMLSLGGFLALQLRDFVDDLPKIKTQLMEHYAYLQDVVKDKVGLSRTEQDAYVEGSVAGKDLISGSSISTFANSLMFLVTIPIYTFLILIYRSLLLNFIIKLVPKKDVLNIETILNNLKSVVRSYIIGLLIQVVCISTLTALGYFAVGMEYCIFLGVLTGLLNLIPYIGILIACVISCLISLTVSTDLSIVLWVLGVNVIVQFLDNNFIMPKVVGSKVSINAMASMIGVIVGGSIAGVAGMFLAIPVLAMLKVVFESTKELEPYGYLIGDEIPQSFNWTKIKLMYSRQMRQEEQSKSENQNEMKSESGNEKDNSTN